MDIDPQKIITNPLFPGVIGAMVGLRFAPGISILERMTNVAAGAACAGFVAPAAGEIFHLTSVSMMGFLAFVTGMFGMSLAASVVQAIRDTQFSVILTGWLSRKG